MITIIILFTQDYIIIIIMIRVKVNVALVLRKEMTLGKMHVLEYSFQLTCIYYAM